MIGSLRKLPGIVSSRAFLFWLLFVWVFYYVTYAIWSKEAFATFVTGLADNLLIQIPFVLFLASGALNILRESAARYREGRGLFLLWIFLPLGLLVFLTGFFMSASLRDHGFIVKGEGETVKPPWQDRTYRISGIKNPIRDEFLDAEPGSLIFEYEPRVTLDTGQGEVEFGVFPPRNIEGTYYHILNFGLAPGVRLSDGKRMLKEGYVIQNILPPGVRDEFELPPFPYRFSLRIAPEKILEKGRTTVKVYDMKNPSYVVTVRRGEDTIFEGESVDGVAFDGLVMSFFEPSSWVMLDIARDPGRLVIVIGIAAILIGAPLMLVLMAYRLMASAPLTLNSGDKTGRDDG
jgi:hypothetical protein